MLQVLATPPFAIDLTLVPGGCGSGGEANAGKADRTEASAACADTLSADTLDAVLAAKHSDFRHRLTRQLVGTGLRLRGQPLQTDAIDFAAHALSALLGSMGFFYGTSTVAPSATSGAGAGRTSPAPLLAVVPSRTLRCSN